MKAAEQPSAPETMKSRPSSSSGGAVTMKSRSHQPLHLPRSSLRSAQFNSSGNLPPSGVAANSISSVTSSFPINSAINPALMVQNPPTKSYDTRDSGTVMVDPMNKANSAMDSAIKQDLAALDDPRILGGILPSLP